jgi:hypothetical protein
VCAFIYPCKHFIAGQTSRTPTCTWTMTRSSRFSGARKSLMLCPSERPPAASIGTGDTGGRLPSVQPNDKSNLALIAIRVHPIA